MYTRMSIDRQKELVRMYRAGERDKAWNLGLGKTLTFIAFQNSRKVNIPGMMQDDIIQSCIMDMMNVISKDLIDWSKGSLYALFNTVCKYHIAALLKRELIPNNRKTLNMAIGLPAFVNEDGNPEEILEAKTKDEKDLALLGQERIVIAELYGKLSKYEQKVLKMYLSGQKMPQIAEATGKSYKSVDNCMQRIKGRARELMAWHENKK